MVITDHKSLTNLMNQRQLMWDQMQWIRLGLFQTIQLVLKYHLGKANVVADALSCSKTDMQMNTNKSEINSGEISAMMGGSPIELAKIERW